VIIKARSSARKIRKFDRSTLWKDKTTTAKFAEFSGWMAAFAVHVVVRAELVVSFAGSFAGCGGAI